MLPAKAKYREKVDHGTQQRSSFDIRKYHYRHYKENNNGEDSTHLAVDKGEVYETYFPRIGVAMSRTSKTYKLI